MHKNTRILITLVALHSLSAGENALGDNLCVVKKTRAVVARPGSCKKAELTAGTIRTTTTNSAADATELVGTELLVNRSGVVTTGSDTTTGLDVGVDRTGATGGTITSTGVNVSVVGDGGGDSTNVGLMVTASGADTNYSGLFLGGNMGVGVSDPDELLEVAGRIHLGQTSAPSVTTDKLYNVGGSLYWSGQELTSGGGGGGSGITSIVAGTGLSGGGSSGAVTLSVSTGTTAQSIVQLNSSAELPAVSGVNLTALNASNVASGTLSDGRLSSNVSLLGQSITLSSEVAGTLPVANGGTGAASLNNLITMGTHTTGNYVATVASSSGISGGAAGSEGAAISLSLDQSFAPTWTSTHSFQNKVNIGTTAASDEVLHVNGRVHLEPAAVPATTTNILYNVAGDLFFNGLNLSDGALGGDITGVTAGSGLTGGGTSGAVSLAVDTGTAANKILQLNGSAQIPAVSGVNLTALNATQLLSGTIPDARLSGSVSLLGSAIDLTTEVAGTLPLANGGIGATSLANLITLGTHTTGNYVEAVSAGTGITVGTAGTEALTNTISIDQAFSPTWTNTHTFSGVASDIATVNNEHLALMPNGTGAVGIGTSSPSAMLDTVITSTSASAATQKAGEFNITDTGVVTSGTDSTYGVDINLSRTGATNGTIESTGLDVSVSGDTGGTSTATGLNVLVGGADTNYAALFNGGSVGIGTSTPDAALDTLFSSTSSSAATQRGSRISVADTGIVTVGADVTYGLEMDVTRTGSTGGTVGATGIDLVVTGDSGGAATTSTVGLSVSVSGADTNLAASFVGGSVSVGGSTAATNANIPSGSIVVDNGTICLEDGGSNCDDVARDEGTVYSVGVAVTGIDLAEEFPIESNDSLAPGELVMVNTKKAPRCLASKKSPDGARVCEITEDGYVPFVTRTTGKKEDIRRVLGVVSTTPGLTLGGFGREGLIMYQKAPIALAGRVPVKVTLENGQIDVGDRVTVSSTPGHGMRASEGDLVVGIALEPYGVNGEDRGSPGTIVVLVK